MHALFLQLNTVSLDVRVIAEDHCSSQIKLDLLSHTIGPLAFILTRWQYRWNGVGECVFLYVCVCVCVFMRVYALSKRAPSCSDIHGVA